MAINFKEMLEKVKESSGREIEASKNEKNSYSWVQKHYKEFSNKLTEENSRSLLD